MFLGSWKKHVLVLLTFCATVMIIGAIRPHQVDAGPQPTPCLADWQNVGDAVKVQLDSTGCHAVFEFPNEAGAKQAVAFRIDPSFYDPAYPVHIIICKMSDGTTPGNGVKITSPSLPRNALLEFRREVQFGTLSAAGKDCLRLNVEDSKQTLLIQTIGAPAFQITVDVDGTYPKEAQ